MLSKNILKKVNNLGDKISIILPDDLKKEIDKLRAHDQEDQSNFIRKLLWKSVAREKLENAIKDYLNDKISLGKAAEAAGISIWEMFDELKKRNITQNYKISEAELEIEKILKKHNKI
jgi:predicted HTH domain antitoxin